MEKERTMEELFLSRERPSFSRGIYDEVAREICAATAADMMSAAMKEKTPVTEIRPGVVVHRTTYNVARWLPNHPVVVTRVENSKWWKGIWVTDDPEEIKKAKEVYTNESCLEILAWCQKQKAERVARLSASGEAAEAEQKA